MPYHILFIKPFHELFDGLYPPGCSLPPNREFVLLGRENPEPDKSGGASSDQEDRCHIQDDRWLDSKTYQQQQTEKVGYKQNTAEQKYQLERRESTLQVELGLLLQMDQWLDDFD